MIYYNDSRITIRLLKSEDAEQFAAEENSQGWDTNKEKFLMRLKDMQDKKCIALAADYLGSPAGYINIYPDCKWGALGGKGYTEIIDFAVLEKFRKKGIGSKLMDIAEQLSAEYSDTVYLGVGLHSGYGSAQRLYVKRGYIPDGSGVWYGDNVFPEYAECKNNDDLNLYLLKKLR